MKNKSGNFKIGVMVDSLRLNFYEGIKKASQIGAEGIQMYSVSGEMSTENMTSSKRRDILDIIKSHGLVVTAVCGDMGGHGFSIACDNNWKIEKSKRILELAKDFECDIVTTHIGVIPSDSMHSRWRILQEACERLGEFGDEVGGFFAIETGPETACTLSNFLKSLCSKRIKVNLDPGNLVMVTGDCPVKAVETLKDYIIHTHAKDGIMLKSTDPEIIYNYLAESGIEGINLKEYFMETPLGEGQVDFDNYLRALSSIGFNGFLTIEREVGENPEKDIIDAIKFLKKKMDQQ